MGRFINWSHALYDIDLVSQSVGSDFAREPIKKSGQATGDKMQFFHEVTNQMLKSSPPLSVCSIEQSEIDLAHFSRHSGATAFSEGGASSHES
jgi:hypothetical protein